MKVRLNLSNTSGNCARLQAVTNNTQIQPVYAKPRTSDTRNSCGDISKANEILGFKPRISLEEGLLDFVKSWKQ